MTPDPLSGPRLAAVGLAPDVWVRALLAVDPGLGGICLRAAASPAREDWVRRAASGFASPARRLPPGAGDDRVFGGLDLAATLAAERPVMAAGLIDDLGSGLLIIPMAERLPVTRSVRLAQAWDAGAGFAALALDESGEDEDGPPPALLDRLAFHLDLPLTPLSAGAPAAGFSAQEIVRARSRLPDIVDAGDPARLLATTAAAVGIRSLRAPQLAVRAARALAALTGAETTTSELIEHAAALVLAPRATQMPAPEEPDEAAPEETPPEAPPPDAEQEETAQPAQSDTPQDLVLEAVRAAIPPDLLATLAARNALTRTSGAAAGAGDDQKGAARGRPAGSRRGDPRSGSRLDLVATLRTAAPWQRIRRALDPAGTERIRVTADDFRVKHYKQAREKVVIFAVDASGSAALTRLAETKGAIELMLAEAYVRREQVALIAFRGEEAQLLLPPTRSLVQAKRRLSALPGGGGTPLAAGLVAAAQLADQIRRKGQSPHIAVLTDGRANIARDGNPGRAQATEDALSAARSIRASGWPAMVIDTGPRPQSAARELATALGGLYLPMPRADARALDLAMRAALGPAAGAA